jgi:hypothetical protein
VLAQCFCLSGCAKNGFQHNGGFRATYLEYLAVATFAKFRQSAPFFQVMKKVRDVPNERIKNGFAGISAFRLQIKNH